MAKGTALTNVNLMEWRVFVFKCVRVCAAHLQDKQAGLQQVSAQQ
jgi:hypothetical protein